MLCSDVGAFFNQFPANIKLVTSAILRVSGLAGLIPSLVTPLSISSMVLFSRKLYFNHLVPKTNPFMNAQNSNKKQIVVIKKKNQKPKKKVLVDYNTKKNKVRGTMRVSNFGGQVKGAMSMGFGKYLNSIPSVSRFGEVYRDPFTKNSARLPVWPVNDTYLIRSTVRAVGKTNGNNYGCCSIWSMNGAVNDNAFLVYSDGTAGDDFEPFQPGMAQANSNSPFSISSFDFTDGENTNTHSARIVSVGIRVRYIGTNLNKGGRVVMGINPNRMNSIYPISLDDITRWPGFKDLPFDDKWHGLHRQIDLNEDFFYQAHDKTVNTGNGWCYNNDVTATSQDAYNSMIIIVQSAGPEQPFEIEVVGHYEIIGRNLPNTSISVPHDNAVKMLVTGKKALDRQSSTTDMIVPSGNNDSFFSKIGGALGDVGKELLFGSLF